MTPGFSTPGSGKQGRRFGAKWTDADWSGSLPAAWGDSDKATPEVLVLDATGIRVCSVQTRGSALDVSAGSMLQRRADAGP